MDLHELNSDAESAAPITDTTDMKVGEKRPLTADGVSVVKELLVEGSGEDQPEKGDEVFVHYVGTLQDGTKFDSSRDRNDFFKFTLGVGQVIKGWDVGVASMRKGEKCNLVCTSDYAYGDRGSPPNIPPGATLHFEVELFRWKSASDMTGDGGVIKKIQHQGKGYKKPKDNDEVTVKYIAKLKDGTVVDETKEEGEMLTLKAGVLCDGLMVILKDMKVGEQAKCTISGPYLKGYDRYLVPDGQPLLMDVTLVAIHEVTMVKTDGSVTKKTLAESDGYTFPKDGAKVGAKVTGRLQNGVVFEQTENDALLQWTVDEEEVCEGLDLAVVKMKKGERAEITLAPQWAYGTVGADKPLAPVPADATVIYEVELVEVENPKESYLMSTAEKFETCEAEKAKGNDLFKGGKYTRALKKYSRALTAVEANSGFTDEEKENAKKLMLPLHLNKAAVQLKLKAWQDVQKSCAAALEMEGQSQNVKALFRRAQALFNTRDLELAQRDLKAALEVEPTNRDMRAWLKKVKEAMKEEYNKQKGVFGNMFARMAEKGGDLYDEPPKAAEEVSGQSVEIDTPMHITEEPVEAGPDLDVSGVTNINTSEDPYL